MHLKSCLLVVVLLIISLLNTSEALWCYECVSNQPGCGEPLNWLWHWTTVCPEDNDVCVKILEVKDAETVITRSCLSTLIGKRTDIPADRYEGCRKASVDVKLANYVNNTIKELDIKRDYYDNTTWCFCFLDHRCNESSFIVPCATTILMGALFSFIIRI
ncbi:hypothetical protein WA026_002321 [Henosepilachna vigintioctopunctata]|uniref:Protein sleepless n=1 Tax=Henosepilachna vigintioctopunctata TaxID=420089 RepID=A0AAW1TUG6_9CUCU